MILPVAYFGPVLYYKLRLQYPHLIEIHENFQKRSIRNRCTILSANGPQVLSVPLQKGKTKNKITEVKVAYHEDWTTKHLRSLESAYRSAPYYEFYIDKIKAILISKPILLYQLFKDIDNFLQSQISQLNLVTTEKYHTTCNEEYLDFRSNIKLENFKVIHYNQVFEDKYGYTENLSILDLLFNVGPETKRILSC